MLLVAALLLTAGLCAGAVVWGSRTIAVEIRAAAREQASKGRTLALLNVFAPGVAASAERPQALLVWQPLAGVARGLFPEEFAALDAARGRPFPFGPEHIEAAHARWTTDWLAWERTHDADYKLKAAAVEAELLVSGGSATVRARLEAVEREKIELYQRRYEEYVRTARALQSLQQPHA